MYVKVWYDMGRKHTAWYYISHYEFRRVFGFEEPRELIVKRAKTLDYRFTSRIDETWTRLKRFIDFVELGYLVVPEKIECVFEKPCI